MRVRLTKLAQLFILSQRYEDHTLLVVEQKIIINKLIIFTLQTFVNKCIRKKRKHIVQIKVSGQELYIRGNNHGYKMKNTRLNKILTMRFILRNY